ncbi:MAG: hypothetical protein AB9842_07225 [Bacteroidales bacterium]
MINIVIADHNETYCDSLKTLLEQVEGFRVIQTISDRDQVKSVRFDLADVMLIDIDFYNQIYSYLVRINTNNSYNFKTIILAMFSDEVDTEKEPVEIISKSSLKHDFVSRIEKVTQNSLK